MSGVVASVPVRWGDMDALGHVNNTVYFQYCESGRIAYFEALDLLKYRIKESEGPGIVAANLNFRRQVRYPGTISVTTHAAKVGARSFTLSHVLADASDGAVVADGESVVVWIDYKQAKALPLPDPLVQAIAQLEANPALGRRERV